MPHSNNTPASKQKQKYAKKVLSHTSGAQKKKPKSTAIKPSTIKALVTGKHVAPNARIARVRKPLTLSHSAFQKSTVEHGSGQRFHAFSNISFQNATEAKTYAKDTGLSPMQTKQDWGTPDVKGSRPQTKMHRSRRGSIVGISPMPDGSVKAWRLHSLPTSEAIRTGATTSQDFNQAFEASAQRLSTPAVNSKGKTQSVNSILSDVGKVRFNSTTSKFDFVDVTHAMGVSGSGLDKKLSSAPTEFYQPSIIVAKQAGKKARPEQTYHSEPMAVTLHNDSRTAPLASETGLVGSFASFPNQVCRQCGDMLQSNVGKHGVFTGVPGRPFGGQKEGDMFSKHTGSTVSRAVPMSELKSDPTNRKEVLSLFQHHNK